MDCKSNPVDGFSWGRLAALWPSKLRWTVALSVVFWTPYLFLSRHAFFPLHKLPTLWIDQRIQFQPVAWVWVYLSAYPLTALVAWLITAHRELRRFGVGLMTLSAASFVIFMLFPVASPRPARMDASPFFVFVAAIDGPLNSFPSLHAGVVAYACAAARRLTLPSANRGWTLLFSGWAALILYSTLATKQHYALDLLAGGILGWTAQSIVFRREPPLTAG